MPAPDSVLKLCETFASHRDHYRSSSYNETELRREFLDPFFKALGWDIDNEQGYADAYKDVVHEDAIKIGGATKAPDYCFRIGGTRKFFTEAKKPSVNIKSDTSPAYQLRRYAWSAKLPLSILSDFEEFAIYDCRQKPLPADQASVARTFYCTSAEYPEKWDEIAAIFSREAVLKGSFDRYALATKGKRGTTLVDDDFLSEIERWRELIAKNLALRNPALTQRDLNFSVQKIIDRLIFLRICEDRGTEEYERMRKRLAGKNLYPILLEEFRRADDRYNSGLFHFTTEKDRPEAPDTLTPALNLDDKVIKDIVKNLYYPDSSYEFSVMPADILGQVYEQFLGKTIYLTAGHQAKIEEKPEVRKAGGVYYTPKYIVDYIVQNTLGKLLNEPAPISIEAAAALKVLDPACGSGSFLIVAYQYLLDWHRDQYTLDPATLHPDPKKAERYSKGKNPVIYQAKGGEWRLTIAERKRILLNNIHGVDIDSQAVEVTKLSLLLKVLEGETSDSAERDLFNERQRILPDLGANIRCGNSLIGPDFYEQENLPTLDDETRYRINVFDWKTGFPKVFKKGGFDCVIGNPPYIFSRELFTDPERQYYATNFKLGWEKQNTFMLFMESMLLHLLNLSGLGAFIVPNSWLTVESARNLRKTFLNHLTEVIDFNYLVFPKVSMEPCVFVIKGTPLTSDVLALRIESREEFEQNIPTPIPRSRWIGGDERISIPRSEALGMLLDRLVSRNSTIEDSFDVRTGLQAYEKGRGKPAQTADDVKRHIFDFNEKVDNTTHAYLEGKDVGRYRLTWSGMWMRYGPWLSQPRDLEMFNRPRVLIREITGPLPRCIHSVFTNKRLLSNKSILTVLSPSDDSEGLFALAGILNSKLISVYYKERAVKGARKVFPKIVIKNLREFPYPRAVNSANKNRLFTLVEGMLALHVKQAAERNPDTQRHIAAEIAATDRRIDRLVYELYALTPEEIALVEA